MATPNNSRWDNFLDEEEDYHILPVEDVVIDTSQIPSFLFDYQRYFGIDNPFGSISVADALQRRHFFFRRPLDALFQKFQWTIYNRVRLFNNHHNTQEIPLVKNLLIVGSTGQGKSTALSYLADHYSFLASQSRTSPTPLDYLLLPAFSFDAKSETQNERLSPTFVSSQLDSLQESQVVFIDNLAALATGWTLPLTAGGLRELIFESGSDNDLRYSQKTLIATISTVEYLTLQNDPDFRNLLAHFEPVFLETYYTSDDIYQILLRRVIGSERIKEARGGRGSQYQLTHFIETPALEGIQNPLQLIARISLNNPKLALTTLHDLIVTAVSTTSTDTTVVVNRELLVRHKSALLIAAKISECTSPAINSYQQVRNNFPFIDEPETDIQDQFNYFNTLFSETHREYIFRRLLMNQGRFSLANQGHFLRHVDIFNVLLDPSFFITQTDIVDYFIQTETPEGIQLTEESLRDLRLNNKQRIFYHFDKINRIMQMDLQGELLYHIRHGKEKIYLISELMVLVLEQYYNRRWMRLTAAVSSNELLQPPIQRL